MNLEGRGGFDWRSLFSWSIGLRITIAISLAALLPVILAFVLLQREISINDQENLRDSFPFSGVSRILAVCPGVDGD